MGGTNHRATWNVSGIDVKLICIRNFASLVKIPAVLNSQASLRSRRRSNRKTAKSPRSCIIGIIYKTVCGDSRRSSATKLWYHGKSTLCIYMRPFPYVAWWLVIIIVGPLFDGDRGAVMKNAESGTNGEHFTATGD